MDHLLSQVTAERARIFVVDVGSDHFTEIGSPASAHGFRNAVHKDQGQTVGSKTLFDPQGDDCVIGSGQAIASRDEP